jgi:hypothetical protein
MTTISALIAVPYKLARLPLVVIDSSLSDRLSETSVPRVTLDRAIGSADKLAGALLRDQDIARIGAERIARSQKLVTAAKLEQQADSRREQARETLTEGREEAAEKRKAAEQRAVSGLDEADAAEARGKQHAKARAAKTAAAKKSAAKKRAVSRASAVERRKAHVDSAAEAKKRAAQRKAKAELDDARETKQAAADARADAERLSDLTEAKKQDRKQS